MAGGAPEGKAPTAAGALLANSCTNASVFDKSPAILATAVRLIEPSSTFVSSQRMRSPSNMPAFTAALSLYERSCGLIRRSAQPTAVDLSMREANNEEKTSEPVKREGGGWGGSADWGAPRCAAMRERYIRPCRGRFASAARHAPRKAVACGELEARWDSVSKRAFQMSCSSGPETMTPKALQRSIASEELRKGVTAARRTIAGSRVGG